MRLLASRLGSRYPDLVPVAHSILSTMADDEFLADAAHAFAAQMSSQLSGEGQSHPILGKIRRVSFDHGMATSLVDVGGQTQTGTLEELSSALEVPMPVIEAGDSNAFSKAALGAAARIREKIMSLLIKRLDELTERTGNVIDMQGARDGKALCDMLERMDISFDSQGRPVVPGFLVHPSSERSLRETLDEPAVRLRMDVIIREKWLNRYTLKFSS